MAVSSHDRGPSKIASLDCGDEMVIVFTQPEVSWSLVEIPLKKIENIRPSNH